MRLAWWRTAAVLVGVVYTRRRSDLVAIAGRASVSIVQYPFRLWLRQAASPRGFCG